MSSFTILREEQVYGSEQLDLMKKHGVEFSLTDFAILLGACTKSYDKEKNERYGHWWLYGDNLSYTFAAGNKKPTNIFAGSRSVGALPVIELEEIINDPSELTKNENGELEFEYGFYPQTVVDGELASELENNLESLSQTGKIYTTDARNFRDEADFYPFPNIEYEYNGKKYIRYVANENASGEVLSNGQVVRPGKVFWISVEPIKWLVDAETHLALPKKILFSGINYNNSYDIELERKNFERSSLKTFINGIFAKDIIPYKTYEKDTIEEDSNMRK